MSLDLIAVILLILLLVGVFPGWPHASRWGYGPVGVIVIVLIVLLLLRVV